jgi:hypothetical protein
MLHSTAANKQDAAAPFDRIGRGRRTSDREGAMAIFEGRDRTRNTMIAVAVVVILVIIYLYA